MIELGLPIFLFCLVFGTYGALRLGNDVFELICKR